MLYSLRDGECGCGEVGVEVALGPGRGARGCRPLFTRKLGFARGEVAHLVRLITQWVRFDDLHGSTRSRRRELVRRPRGTLDPDPLNGVRDWLKVRVGQF